MPLAIFSLDGGSATAFATSSSKGGARRLHVRSGAGSGNVAAAVVGAERGFATNGSRPGTLAEKGFRWASSAKIICGGFPLAIVRYQGQIVGFANVLRGAEKHELSVDLMRFHRPSRLRRAVMDYLFIELMLWGRAAGYEWFNLGMAPLSGLDVGPLAPLWNRVGTLVFRHGEHFYNFQGLRQYKEKFHPQWEPKYLASPGGLRLPRILANVATLISAGDARLSKELMRTCRGAWMVRAQRSAEAGRRFLVPPGLTIGAVSGKARTQIQRRF